MDSFQRMTVLESENSQRRNEILLMQDQMIEMATLIDRLVDRCLALENRVASDGMAAALSRGGGQGG